MARLDVLNHGIKRYMNVFNINQTERVLCQGFMYVRYTQPPADLFDWYVDYLDDEEEVEPRAGGGAPTTIGALVRQMLIKLDWFSTLFPRIPVPIQKQIEQRYVLFCLILMWFLTPFQPVSCDEYGYPSDSYL